MIFIWGSRLYGKVDEVPGLFYVATHFGHLWYLPLFPLGSYLVVGESGDQWQGVKAPFSFKSLGVAWARVFGLVGGVVGVFVGVMMVLEEYPDWYVPMGLGVLGLGLGISTFVLRSVKRPSYERAHALGEIVGLNERGKIIIDRYYEVITEAEAERALADYDAVEVEEEARVRAEAESGDGGVV